MIMINIRNILFFLSYIFFDDFFRELVDLWVVPYFIFIIKLNEY